MLQTVSIERSAAGPVITDIGWREQSRHGSYIIRVDQRTNTVTTLVTLTWDPAYSDGWRRFAWTVTSQPGAIITQLLVLASPEVQVEPAAPLTPGAADVRTSIVRLQAADFVPQLGEPVRLGSLLPPRCPVVVSSASPDRSDPVLAAPTDPSAPVPAMPLVDEASVRWLPDGAEVRHEHGHWMVRIKVDQRAPHGFGLQLDAAPARGVYALASSAFTLRVACRGDVEVEVQERSTRAPLLPDAGLSQRVRGSHVDVSVGVDDARDPLALTGVDLDRARRYQVVPATPLPTNLESLVFNLPVQLTVLALSVLPGGAGAVAGVVLLVYELGNLASAAAFGQDLLGNPVPEENLPVMAAFAIVSTFATAFQVGTVLRAADAATRSRLVAVAGKISAGVPGEQAVDAAAALLDRFCSPLVRDAVRRMDRATAQRVLTALEAIATGADPNAIKQLSRVLVKELTPLLDNVPRTYGIPTALYTEAMDVVHVADTGIYASLTAEQQVAAARAFLRARKAADPGLLRLAEISPDLDAEYTELVRDTILQKVFGPTLEGFRVPLLQPAMLTEGIGKGHSAYTASKLAKKEKVKDLLEWVWNQPPNSRYYALLVAELGPDFKQNVLKPVIDSRRYRVDADAVNFLRKHVHTVDDYDAGRALVSEAGLGHLIQLDHLIERRILRYWDELLDQHENTGMFSSAMVPSNRFAAANFRKAGMTDFPYVHPVKTALMAKWVPGATEPLFTVQELFDAYQLVFVHELGFSYDTFLAMVESDFRFLWKMVREHADELVAANEPLLHPRLIEAHGSALNIRPKPFQELVLSARRPLSR